MRKQKGFTLVELLVVIAIIGLLSALAVVSLGNIREKGRDTRRLSDMNAVKTAMELITNEYGTYDKVGCAKGAVLNTCGDKLEEFLPTLKNLIDPVGETSCVTDCTKSCNYAYRDLETDSYSVLFYMENGAGQFKEPGCYAQTNKGIAKVK